MECIDCGQDVSPRAAWTEVTGFVDENRDDGGPNAVRLKDPTGRVLCVVCMGDRQREEARKPKRKRVRV